MSMDTRFCVRTYSKVFRFLAQIKRYIAQQAIKQVSKKCIQYCRKKYESLEFALPMLHRNFLLFYLRFSFTFYFEHTSCSREFRVWQMKRQRPCHEATFLVSLVFLKPAVPLEGNYPEAILLAGEKSKSTCLSFCVAGAIPEDV